jgi:anthranilate synthase component I
MHADPLPDDIDLLRVRRHLGLAQAPALLLSAAAGLHGRLDLLPLTTSAPLRVPYPGRPGHATALAVLIEQLQQLEVGRGSDHAGQVFQGGWLLYLAYDFGSIFEPHVELARPELDEPLALLWRIPAAVVRDRQTQQAWLTGTDRDFWQQRLLLAGASNSGALDQIDLGAVFELSEDDPELFLAGVERIHQYLQAGDVFQVNLSRAWRLQSSRKIDMDWLFCRLTAANPAPFAAVLKYADWGLASSSPERLVSVRGDRVETRPIAGTRRRDSDPVKDAALLAELTRDPKERAEHIMLIDLERNDLGRICVPGTVSVDELGGVESYAHVHHLVSNVSGRLRPDSNAWEVLRAVFPGGTITGCPKVRCMQIIGELEATGRGAYTGALGYIGDDGNLDFNILIRTMSCVGDRMVFRAGAGIVADSIAERELSETRAKAKGLLRALENVQ